MILHFELNDVGNVVNLILLVLLLDGLPGRVVVVLVGFDCVLVERMSNSTDLSCFDVHCLGYLGLSGRWWLLLAWNL